MTHFEKCQRSVNAHAKALFDRVEPERAKALLQSYIESSNAIYPEWRDRIFKAALKARGIE